ncbi:MAG: hypothetical protein ACK5LY_11025 [Lachnospirales bacterium]
MKTTNAKKYCANYMPMENSHISLYYDKMSPILSKSTECRNCVYYTSRNCTTTNQPYNNSLDIIC